MIPFESLQVTGSFLYMIKIIEKALYLQRSRQEAVFDNYSSKNIF